MERFGPYVLRCLVGEGGMGTVHEATDPEGRRVAVKVLHADLARREDARRRFRAEMDILAGLDHPHIVRSLATGEVDGRPFLALEYLEGRTLRAELSARGRLSPSEAVRLTAQIASALAAAHEREPPVIHRDLKPENLMILPTGDVKVMDFGIAKVLDALQPATRTTQMVGTAQYMSPEHADGKGVTAASDLYSLGLVLYEMLAGAPPFASTSLLALLRAHAEQTPPPLPLEVRAQLPPALEAVVFALLEKDPARRLQSARALHASLAAMVGLPAMAAPFTPSAAHAPIVALTPAGPVPSPAVRPAEAPAMAPAISPAMAPAMASPPLSPPGPPRVGPHRVGPDTIDLVARLDRPRRRWWIAGLAALAVSGLAAALVLLQPWTWSTGPRARAASSPSAAASAPPAGKPGGDRFLTWLAPASWQEFRASDLLTVAAYRVPGVGAADADVTLRAPSRGPPARVHQDFVKQFLACRGCDRTSTRLVDGMTITTFELTGTFKGVPPHDDVRPDATMLGAVVPVGETFYIVRLLGPSATVNAARADFDALVGSFRPVRL